MKKNLILALFIFITGFIYAVYPVKQSHAQSAWLASELCNIDNRNGYQTLVNNFFGRLPNYFPTSEVSRSAKTRSWKYLGQTQESGTGSMKEYVFYNSSVQEPADANERTSLMEERFLFVSYPTSLVNEIVSELSFGSFGRCNFEETSVSSPPSDTLQPSSENIQILGNGSYAKQTYVNNNGYPVHFTEIIRTTKTNFAGFDNNAEPLVKITVIPEINQDNGAKGWIRYGSIVESFNGEQICPRGERSRGRCYTPPAYEQICLDENHPLYGYYAGKNCYYQMFFYDKASDKTYKIRWSIPYHGPGNGAYGYGRKDTCTAQAEAQTAACSVDRSSWKWAKDYYSDQVFSNSGWMLLKFSYFSCTEGSILVAPTCEENFSYQYVHYYVPEDSSVYNTFKPLTLYDTDAIVSATLPKSEKIAIANIPSCTINSGSSPTRSWIDVYCYRKGLSLDGRVGYGQWHKYDTGSGWLGDLLGDILSLGTLGFSNNFVNLGEANVSVPSFEGVSTDEKEGLLWGFARPVIKNIVGGVDTPAITYNLDFLGTVSNSIANPTRYFGVYSGSDGNQWVWKGRYSEPPTLDFRGPLNVQLPDPIELLWDSTYTYSCAASSTPNVWSGSKPVSGNESITPPRGKYDFFLSCSGLEESVSRNVTTTVLQIPRCSFSANPTSIIPPQVSTLKWSCAYADSCKIDQGIGVVSKTSGSVGVRPGNTTSYTLSCKGLDGEIAVPATVSVSLGAPTSTPYGHIEEVIPR